MHMEVVRDIYHAEILIAIDQFNNAERKLHLPYSLQAKMNFLVFMLELKCPQIPTSERFVHYHNY